MRSRVCLNLLLPEFVIESSSDRAITRRGIDFPEHVAGNRPWASGVRADQEQLFLDPDGSHALTLPVRLPQRK